MFNFLGECGYSVGPCVTKPLRVELNKDFKIEEFISIPKGKLGFTNLKDSLNPKIYKFNNLNEIVWINTFVNDSNCWVPFHEWSNLRLSDIENTLYFFNDSYDEPGSIYFDEEFNVKYMCLSPM